MTWGKFALYAQNGQQQGGLPLQQKCFRNYVVKSVGVFAVRNKVVLGSGGAFDQIRLSW